MVSTTQSPKERQDVNFISMETLKNENLSLRDELRILKSQHLKCGEQHHESKLLAVQDELERCKRDFACVMAAKVRLEAALRKIAAITRDWGDFWKLQRQEMTSSNSAAQSRISSKARDTTVSMKGLSVPLHAYVPPTPSYRTSPAPSANVSGPASSLRYELPPRIHADDKIATAKTSNSQESRFQRSNSRASPSADVEGGCNAETTCDIHSQMGVSHGPSLLSSEQRELPDTEIRPIKHEESDSPVVISSRSLKRNISRMKQERHMVDKGDDLVKKEHASSSPLLTSSPSRKPASMRVLPESMDLDEVPGQTIDTPRKRKRVERSRPKTSTISTPMKPRAHLPCAEARPDVVAESQKVDGAAQSFAAAICSDDRVHTDLENESLRDAVRMHEVRIAQQDAYNDKISNRIRQNHRRLKDVSSIQALHFGESKVTPSSGNSSAQSGEITMSSDAHSRTGYAPDHAQSTYRHDRKFAQVPMLAEDGEDLNPCCDTQALAPTPMSPPKAKAQSTRKAAPQMRSDARQRLPALLNDPSPSRTILALQPPLQRQIADNNNAKAPSVLSSTDSKLATSPAPRSGKSRNTEPDLGIETPLAGRKSSNAQSIIHRQGREERSDEPPIILPEEEPLRARPVHRLSLGDFKLNTAHSEFAYQETVRKHDEKRALKGCTDPFCERCKDAIRFVKASGFTAPLNRGLFDSSPPANEEEEENRLLEDFLGPEEKHRLKRMGTAERVALKERANYQYFMDKYGAHRQAHRRAVSPVDYWNADFPSTQEEAENRKAAKALERLKVKERHAEALKGGYWKFADE